MPLLAPGSRSTCFAFARGAEEYGMKEELGSDGKLWFTSISREASPMGFVRIVRIRSDPSSANLNGSGKAIPGWLPIVGWMVQDAADTGS